MKDFQTGLLLTGALLAAVVGSYGVTMRFKTETDSVTRDEVLEIGRNIRIRESGEGDCGTLAIGTLTARRTSEKGGAEASYEIVIEGADAVLPHDEQEFQYKAEDRVYETVQRQTFKSGTSRPMPRVTGCKVEGIRVSRTRADGTVTPWFSGARATIGSKGCCVYECVETVGDKTNRYPVAYLERSPLRLVPPRAKSRMGKKEMR